MKDHLTRRNFLAATGTAALATTITTVHAAEAGGDLPLRILGIACSPRKGMVA